MSQFSIFFGIIGATFILEDPTTLAVGSLIAKKEISFLFGFSALSLGIFIGDFGLYVLGYLFKRKIFSGKKTYFTPSITQISLARFLPGARTVTFIAAGYGKFPLVRFLLIIFPSSIVWTILLLFFTKQIFSLTHILPFWGNWIVGIIFILILAKMRTLAKVVGMAILIFTVIVHHSIFLRRSTRKEKTLSLSRYCKLAVKILDIEVHSNSSIEDFSGKLIVSNHMSYLDVICLASLYPGIYVTSNEIRNTPVLGLICELCGCLFTERRRDKRSDDLRERELNEMQSVLNDGISVTLFPEGTSTNGLKILPFKTTFFEAAIRTQATIRPVYFSYDEFSGEKCSAKNLDSVCWYGDMSFLPHFLRLCDAKAIKVRINALNELDSKEFKDRKLLAEESFRSIELARMNSM